MGIGDAVRLRIIGLCEERKISINKLCSISGVTQSTILPVRFLLTLRTGAHNSAKRTGQHNLCESPRPA